MADAFPPDDDPVEPFELSVSRALEVVQGWMEDPNRASDLDDLIDGVFVRNMDKTLILSNRSYRELFLPGSAIPGRSSQYYLAPDVAKTSEATDAILFEGARWIEWERPFDLGDGRRADLRIHKCVLRGPTHPPLLIGVIRRIGEPIEAGVARDMETSARVVGGFDAADLRICRGICAGSTNQALSAELGMTTRAVEMRRQKILSQLGLSHTVELVKLLVRLQDRGYLDLGI